MKKKIAFIVAIPGSAHSFLYDHFVQLVKEYDVHLIANFSDEKREKRHLCFKEFLKCRFLKVYLPVLIISALWVPIYYAFVNKEELWPTLYAALYDILWGFKDPVLWFVKILFALYAIFFAFLWLRQSEHTIIAHILLIAGVLAATWIAANLGYPFISISLFVIGIYSSLFKLKVLFKIPLSIYMLAAIGLLYSAFFLLLKDADAAHGVVNCLVVDVVLGMIYLLNPPQLPRMLILATFIIYIVHMKVLELLVANWGHISFLLWAIVSLIVTFLFTYLMKSFKIL